MTNRRILLLTTKGLQAYKCRGKEACVEAEFLEPSEFNSYLRANPKIVCELLVDLPEEGFQFESLPHVLGRGRSAMLRRRQEFHSHGSRLCAALPQGRETDRRRDDRFLFATIARPATLEPWLRCLEEREMPLAGIFSVAQLAAAAATAVVARKFVLATVGRSGLRQTFIVDGQLRFSRLTALPGPLVEDAAPACAAEAVSMRRYLGGQRLVDHGFVLPVIVLAHPLDVDCFQSHCRNTPELSFDYLDITATAKRCRLHTPLRDSSSDVLFTHLLATKPPSRQFATPGMRRLWRVGRVRRALNASGVAAFIASVVFFGWRMNAAANMQDAADQLRAQNDAYESRHSESMSRAAAQRDLRALADSLASLERTSPGPSPLLHRLGKALDEFPAAELDALDWRIDDGYENAGNPFAVLDVRGRLPSGPDAASGGLDPLIARLHDDPTLRTAVLKAPFAADSEHAVTSTDPSWKDGAFILRMAQPL